MCDQNCLLPVAAKDAFLDTSILKLYFLYSWLNPSESYGMWKKFFSVVLHSLCLILFDFYYSGPQDHLRSSERSVFIISIYNASKADVLSANFSSRLLLVGAKALMKAYQLTLVIIVIFFFFPGNINFN